MVKARLQPWWSRVENDSKSTSQLYFSPSEQTQNYHLCRIWSGSDGRHKNRRRVLIISFFSYISCIPRHCFQAAFVIPIMLELKTDPMYNVCLLSLLYIWCILIKFKIPHDVFFRSSCDWPWQLMTLKVHGLAMRMAPALYLQIASMSRSIASVSMLGQQLFKL